MVEIKIDTEKMNEIGTSICAECKELNTLIEGLFAIFEKLPKENIWLGVASEKYLQKIMPMKSMYLEFNKVCEAYGNHVLKCSTQYGGLGKKYRKDKDEDENIY